jgi:hypothetical protein
LPFRARPTIPAAYRLYRGIQPVYRCTNGQICAGLPALIGFS